MGRWHNETIGETRVTAPGSALDRKLATLDGWDPLDEQAQTTTDEVPEKPAKSASKADWVDYAVKVGGLDETTADAMSRDDLAAQFADA